MMRTQARVRLTCARCQYEDKGTFRHDLVEGKIYCDVCHRKVRNARTTDDAKVTPA